MRIAISFERVDPSRGGAETYVADLCRGLMRAGHEVALFATSAATGALPAEVEHVAIPPRGATRSAQIWNFAVDSEKALAGARADCIVGCINTWAQDVLIPQGGVRPASLIHNARRFPAGWRRGLYRLGKALNPKAGLYKAIERKQYDPARTTRYVAPSHFVQTHLRKFYNVPDERIDVIPNAIDAGRLALADPAGVRARIRAAHGLAEDDVVGLFVGHNFWLKGLRPLLRALAGEPGDTGRPPIKLLICGGGKAAPFEKMIADWGLGDSVRMVGFASDIREYYHATDFFASPTYYDPCSLVVFEALACGLPVITTACNGAGEVMAPGREGFVVPEPDDLPALREALGAMADRPRRAAMAESARALGAEQTFDRHLARLLPILSDVAARKECARRATATFAMGGRA